MVTVNGRTRTAIEMSLLTLLVLPTACDSFLLSEMFARPDDSPLAVSPAAVAVRPRDIVQFSGSGGVGGYRFRLNETGAGEINEETGEYKAPQTIETSPLEATVTLTDEAGTTVEAYLFVLKRERLQVDPRVAHVAYDSQAGVTLRASDGEPEYTFRIVEGEDLGYLETAKDSHSATFMPKADNSDTGVVVVELNDARTSIQSRIYLVDKDDYYLVPGMNPVEQEEWTELKVNAPGAENPEIQFDHSDVSQKGEIDEIDGSSGGYTAGAYIGPVRLDLLDDQDNVRYSLEMTVVPRTPTNFRADGDTGNDRTIDVRWSHRYSEHEGFRLERSTSGGPFEVVNGGDLIDPGTRSFTDDKRNRNRVYEYRLYTVGEGGAQEYVSPPTEIRFAVSNP